MTKQLTSAEAAAVVYGSPGTKVFDCTGNPVWVSDTGMLHSGQYDSSCALSSRRAPFTLPADPDELPEDVARCLVKDGAFHAALTALWKHIKPEAKR